MSEQDQNQVKSDIIVTAREGYSVLLEIDGRMFDIDCHESINLSEIFSADILEKCSSLNTHLKDGNLITLKEVIKLSVDVTAAAEIKPLREETAQHITSQYDQAEKDVNRTNIELETRANITKNTREHIQERVQASKKDILATDQKILVKTVQTTNNVDATPTERKNAMTAEELTLGVTMDISASEFADKQAKSKAKLDASEIADETRAQNEIDEQNAE